MKLRRTLHTVKTAPDLTPLVDVVLLLLIFFLLTSSFVFQPGIKVDPPAGPGVGGVNTRSIISIFPQDPPLIFFNDQKVSLTALEDKLQQLGREQMNAPVVIKADRTVSHGLFVKVMNLAVSVGLPVVIATQPEEREEE